MSAFLLLVYPVALILGGMLLGWLARWYRYGGRCGPGGLTEGVPNIDAGRGTVALDGTEPVKTAGTRRAQAAEDARAALGSLRSGYADGKRTDASGAAIDGSPAARVGALAGNAAAAAASVGGGVAEASASVSTAMRETGTDMAASVSSAASGAVDGAKSGLAAMKEGYAEGKAPGETPGEPADGSTAAKVGAAVGSAVTSAKETAAVAAARTKSATAPLHDGTAKDRIVETTGGAKQAVKDTASGAVDGTKSGLAALKEGYAEGKAPGETPEEPADGSALAKVGAAVGGAVASVKDTAASVADGTKSAVEPLRDGTVKDRIAEATSGATQAVTDTASGAADGTKSGLSALKEGYAEGKASGATPEEPADGSALAKVGALVGGAVASASGAISGAVDTAKAAVVPKDDATGDDTVEDVAQRAARHDRGLPGATIGQEDGTPFVGDDPAPVRTRPATGPVDPSGGDPVEADTAALRSRFATLAEEAADDAETDDAASDPLDGVEEEARRLIESGEDIGKPGNALAAPVQGRAPDDLKRISGVGPRIERSLNDEGIYYFDQIASFTARDLAWADRTLGFHGRVVRDRWMPQARGLAEGGNREAADVPVGHRVEGGASAGSPVNTPLNAAEAEALRLIEREGGYAATSQNRPEVLMRDGPVGGRKDDLKRIKGVGNKLERVLNGLGVYYFRQIAAFSASDIAWVDSKLKFKGRIVRDRWVPQAAMFERNRDI